MFFIRLLRNFQLINFFSADFSEEKEDEIEDMFKDDLEQEANKLLQEMRSKDKEQKLLKIKAMDNLDKLQAQETKNRKNTNQDEKTNEILNELGVSSMAQEDYQAKVDMETSKGSNETFGDSAEGFIRSKKDQNVQDVEVTSNVIMNDDFIKKLDIEGEEFSQDELLELQNKLGTYGFNFFQCEILHTLHVALKSNV